MNIADRMCAAMPEWKAFPRIDISNVAAFLYPARANTKARPSKDFPNIAPPWRDAVFFWKYPKDAEGFAGVEVCAYAHAERALFNRDEWKDSATWIPYREDSGHIPEGFEVGWRVGMEFYDSDDRIKRLHGFDPKVYRLANGSRVKDGGWPVQVGIMIDADGKFITYETGITDPGVRIGLTRPENKDLLDWIRTEVQGLAVIVLFATSFVHCKNVTVEKHEPSVKLVKKQMKHRGIPKLSYHVLIIEPMKKVLTDEGGIGKGGTLSKALHICRGHFKDYRDGAGLFGKYNGLYWWEQTIRGSKEDGIVLKDYKVKVR